MLRPRFIIRKCWFTLLMVGAILYVYSVSLQQKEKSIQELSFRIEEIEKEKWVACMEKEELKARLFSECDPAWIEVVLMRDLGVVPEGFLKVHFTR